MDRNARMTIPEHGLFDFFGFQEVRQCKIYHCTRVKLTLFRVYIESLTMSSQEQPKKKSKRDNGLFCLYSECTCVDVMYFVPVCIWKNTRLVMATNHKQQCFCKSASAIVKRAPPQDTLERTIWRK